MHDDRDSAEELAALRAAVLRHHDQSVRLLPRPRRLRVMRRLQRLHLSWLVLAWALVDAERMFLPGGLFANEEQAVRMYRQLSGKDQDVARDEVWRVVGQLWALDDRLHEPLGDERPGAPRGADPGELAAAAGALLGYYLAGRRTDDELLGEVEASWAEFEASWAEFEEVTEQQREPAVGRGLAGHRRAEPAVEERVQAAADRYRGLAALV